MREKIFRRLNNEIPYTVGLVIRHWENSNPEAIIIHIDVLVKSTSVGNILVGTGGESINYIVENSKIDLEIFFKKNVILRLHVVPLKRPIASK